MISLVIDVDSLRNQFHNVRWNRSLDIPGSAIVIYTAQSTHLVVCRVVLADQLLYLRWRQDPADVEQDVNVGSRGLK
jgi:hypothetical protein